jgi:hypothetical protein
MCDRSEETAPMMKTQKLSLIAAAAFLAALSLPRSSSAQIFVPPAGSIYGFWSGFETYTVSLYYHGNLVDFYSDSGPAILEAAFYDNFAVMSVGGTSTDSQISGNGPYHQALGPTSASGTIFPYPDQAALVYVNYFLTYDSILPDGQINTGSGAALADFTSTILITPTGDESVTFATFQSTSSIPEPPSIMLAALAVLLIAVVVRMRGLRRRLVARRLYGTR